MTDVVGCERPDDRGEVAVATPLIPAGFDFTDPDLYATRLPLAEFAELRKTAPVWWNPQRHNLAGFGDEGYWVVTRLEDVKAISVTASSSRRRRRRRSSGSARP